MCLKYPVSTVSLNLEFLPRAFRLNLTHNRDVTVLSRVIRVFSQPGLPQMIRRAEGMLADSRIPSPRSKFAPDRLDLHINIVDLIGNLNTFTPMMTPSTVQVSLICTVETRILPKYTIKRENEGK